MNKLCALLLLAACAHARPEGGPAETEVSVVDEAGDAVTDVQVMPLRSQVCWPTTRIVIVRLVPVGAVLASETGMV